MKNARLAVPSVAPGGLDAAVDEHFGHCAVYTVVEIADGAVTNVQTVPNVPHESGGCLAPVQVLARQGVTAMIAGGMGMRPLMGFKEAGIDVFHGGAAPSVSFAVQQFLGGKLMRFTTDFTCKGGCSGH